MRSSLDSQCTRAPRGITPRARLRSRVPACSCNFMICKRMRTAHMLSKVASRLRSRVLRRAHCRAGIDLCVRRSRFGCKHSGVAACLESHRIEHGQCFYLRSLRRHGRVTPWRVGGRRRVPQSGCRRLRWGYGQVRRAAVLACVQCATKASCSSSLPIDTLHAKSKRSVETVVSSALDESAEICLMRMAVCQRRSERLAATSSD